ncbi:MAG: hypothetical protein WDA22_01815 [Bacteroidota bacterium]
MKTIKLITGIIIVLFAQHAVGQVEAQTTISSMYDDNVNNNALQLQSNVTTMNFTGGYVLEGESSLTQLSYDGTFTYFESLLERTNHFHSLNADFSQYYGDDNENAFNISGLIGTSVNRDAYTIFDHNVYSGNMNYKYFVADWMIHKAGYSLRNITFFSLDDFSYTEHSIFLHAAFAATSTTTAIIQTDLGSKFYSSTPSMASSSMRKGVLSSLMPSVTQFIGTIKIGQRLSDEIGLSVTGRYQWNLQKQTRYLSSEYGFISDDELFDDHYGYEGLHTSATVTSLLSESMTLKLSGGIQNKLYSSLAAYDMAGNYVADQRIDMRSYINIGLSKNFDELGFSLKGAIDIIQNSSNDAFYEYNNNAVTLEVGIPF